MNFMETLGTSADYKNNKWKNKESLFVLDRHLDLGGHFRTQIRAISALTNRPISVLSHRDAANVNFGDQVNIIAQLQFRVQDLGKADEVIEVDVRTILKYISHGILGKKLKSLLVPSGRGYELILICRILEEVDRQDLDPIKIWVRILDDTQFQDIPLHVFVLMRRFIERKRLHILTETANFRSVLEERYLLPCSGRLTLPCNDTLFEKLYFERPNVIEFKASKKPLKVLIPGGNRIEKGHQRIAQIVRELANTELCKQTGVEISLQRPRQRLLSWRGRHLIAAKILAVMVRLQGKRIRLRILPAVVDDAFFVNELEGSQMVLLPYLYESYRHRGSGVVLDAVSAGIPVVYTRGMGYSEILNSGNAVAINGCCEIGEAVEKVFGAENMAERTVDAQNMLRNLYDEASSLLQNGICE